LDAVAVNLHNASWGEQKRVRCPRTVDGGTEGVAVVVDKNNKVRAFTLLEGTGDHYEEVRIIYDDQERPRLLFVSWSDVEGGSSEQFVRLDAVGTVLDCQDHSLADGLPRPSLCVDERPDRNLSPDVQAALRESNDTGPANRHRDVLKALVPRDEFAKCTIAIAQ
jgi:hypothetical protein